jgi:hypothetical protein
MNAKEAAKLSEKNNQHIERGKAQRAEKERISRIQREKEKRSKFFQDLSEAAVSGIKYAIAQGSKHYDLTMWISADTAVQAKEILEKHGYIDLIKKLERKLRRDGYKVSHELETSRHTTQHESSVPDYDYYTYHAYIRIAW